MGVRAPCEGHKVFTNPSNATPHERADAIEMCHHCPLRTQCEQQATTAGDTLDGQWRSHAHDVIQAGQWFRTSETRTTRHPRQPTPTVCAHCGRPMIARDKHVALTPDVLTHAARGYCRVCYAMLKRRGLLNTLRPKHQAALGWREQHVRRPA